MKAKCGKCGSSVSSDEAQCDVCGHFNKHPNPGEWRKARRAFLDALKRYIPQCPNCGAYIMTEEECDIFEEEGIGGEGDLQLKNLAIRSYNKPDRCIYCEDE